MDEKGKIHYSDSAPASNVVEEVNIDPGPTPEEIEQAQQRLERLRAIEQKRLEEHEKKKTARQVEKRTNKLRKKERVERCVRAKRELRTLEVQLPVYTRGEQGNRQYIDDATRAKRIQEFKRQIAESCGTNQKDLAKQEATNNELYRCPAARRHLKELQRPELHTPHSKMQAAIEDVKRYCTSK